MEAFELGTAEANSTNANGINRVAKKLFSATTTLKRTLKDSGKEFVIESFDELPNDDKDLLQKAKLLPATAKFVADGEWNCEIALPFIFDSHLILPGKFRVTGMEEGKFDGFDLARFDSIRADVEKLERTK